MPLVPEESETDCGVNVAVALLFRVGLMVADRPITPAKPDWLVSVIVNTVLDASLGSPENTPTPPGKAVIVKSPTTCPLAIGKASKPARGGMNNNTGIIKM